MKRTKKNQLKRNRGWFWQQAKEVAFGFALVFGIGIPGFYLFDYLISK